MKTYGFLAVVANGLLAARPNDTQGISFSSGRYSPSQDAKHEMVLEVHYGFDVSRWLSIQPNLQWVIDAFGKGDIPNALVLGAQTVLDL